MGNANNNGHVEGVVELDPLESARAAHLRYVTDKQPGIRRERAGKGFRYLRVDGKAIRDKQELARINALAIPPAWTDVWICPSPNGHIQATGRDARGRKQYRYHPRWREARDETKYEHTVAFGKMLPTIRRRVGRDLALPGLPRDKVLATVVSLLETTLIRVGNEEYARENKSFGLTTMRNRHINIHGSVLRFRFQGKSGKKHTIGIRDRRLASIVKKCQHLPGQEVFEYVDDQGVIRGITSDDVNQYLREITGQFFTAKDFRTWAGTVLVATALKGFEAFDTQAQARKNIARAIEEVSKRLGNTPAICRKCYVHPAVLDAYLDGTLPEVLRERTSEESKTQPHALQPDEAAVLTFLQMRLDKEEEAGACSSTVA